MTIIEKSKLQQNELHTKLWKIADDLRGNMDASEFKNYILGLIFYRYLSDKINTRANVLLVEDNLTYEQACKSAELQQVLRDTLIKELGFCISPENLFDALIKKIEAKTFEIGDLKNAINSIADSSIGQDSQQDFENLFDDMDLDSTRLGKTYADRGKLIAKVMATVAEISFNNTNSEIDILGDAYEYLIGQFAANAGKKAGEFYTPQQVSKILAKIVSSGRTKIKNVYDPTCGSGSLLLRVSKEIQVSKFYGQEKVATTYNLARMNMLLHDIPYQNFDIKNDDTLQNPQHLQLKFDAVVANPPYSASWTADAKFMLDERFSSYGRLAPKSKADYAFIQHMLHHLDDKGTMAVVLPHGVLFRSASEGEIRKYIIQDKNYLDAVIGLPANIFFGTSIPTVILVFKKCREKDDNILFIDASKNYTKGKNQNILSDSDVDIILDTYKNRQSIDKFSHIATLQEIVDNDYNLNIPRYVDTFEPEEEVDLQQVAQQLKEIDQQIAEIDKELEPYLKELGLL